MTERIADLDGLRVKVVAAERRASTLRSILESIETQQRRFDALEQSPDKITAKTEQTGLSDGVRGILSESPETVFSTGQIRQLLASHGFDTKPRNFGSSLSTTLTRLGKLGKSCFLTITTDAEGNRSYKKNPPNGGNEL